MSRKSHKSVSKKSYVDEALFGNTKADQKSNAGAATVLSTGEIRKLREQAETGKKNDAIVLSKDELDRMRAATVIKSKDE